LKSAYLLPVEGPADEMASAIAAGHHGDASVWEAANEQRKKIINCFSPTIRPHHVFFSA